METKKINKHNYSIVDFVVVFLAWVAAILLVSVVFMKWNLIIY